ncbi:MAG: FtsX-like permease family protein [Planctomycetota bacterium]
MLGLPKSLLSSSVGATPFRHGFTAGALMVGLAMMVSIWTNGNSVLRDWLDTIRFPDAFVNGLLVGLTPEMQQTVEDLEFVEQTSAITLLRVDNEAVGLAGFSRPGTTFIAFEVDAFFEMTNLHWVAGTPEDALPKLRDGTGLLVAQEFLVEREGFGIGDPFPLTHRGKTRDFEIVGAVTSPGLDIVKRYFDFEEEYAEQSIHAVFGSRDVLREFFSTDAIHLIQISLRVDIDDDAAVEQLQAALDTQGLVIGSGRSIKEQITTIGMGSMRIATIVAIGAMLIGCFGVANVLIAGIDARRYEFGVLRSVGAGRGLLARLLFAEVVLVALTACVLGTGLGLQGAWAGQHFSALAAGLELRMRPPVGAIALGWTILLVLTLGFVTPIVLRLSSLRPRALLQSTRG